jgi:hypothetical protein
MVGLYEFSASTPNQLIRGRIRVGETGMCVEFETDSCQAEVTGRPRPRDLSSTTEAQYYCGGAGLAYNPQNPLFAKWYATMEVPRRRQVCNRYETRNGQRVCVSQVSETYYVTQTRSGGVQVRPIR